MAPVRCVMAGASLSPRAPHCTEVELQFQCQLRPPSDLQAVAGTQPARPARRLERLREQNGPVTHERRGRGQHH